jgi:Tfp pilus assembly protein PilX
MRSVDCRQAGGQRGNALIISLILLAILMLFGITAVRTGMVNLRIARNVQMGMEAQMAAQRVLDTKMSSLTTFTDYTNADGAQDVNVTGDGNTLYHVVFDEPECVHIKAAPGYSYDLAPFAPKDTTWRLSAVASDTSAGTGAGVRVTQGVKVRLPVSAVCN